MTMGVVLDSAKLDFFVEIVNHHRLFMGLKTAETGCGIVSCLS